VVLAHREDVEAEGVGELDLLDEVSETLLGVTASEVSSPKV